MNKYELTFLFSFCISVTFIAFADAANHDRDYRFGIAQSDITGPIAEVGFMGYADFYQTSKGLHMRQRARAFYLEDNDRPYAIVIADLGMIFSSLKEGVLKILEKEHPGAFTNENLLLSATHTHSGPGGYAFYPLYNITTLGFNWQNYNIIVRGIADAILKAKRNVISGHISYGHTNVAGLTFNRSLLAFNNNSPQERATHGDTSSATMHMLKFENSDGIVVGMINWFPVHPVSLSLKNPLVSPDNKGLAAYFVEQQMGTTYRKDNEFIGAFAQADEGDVSPYDIDHPPSTDEQEFAGLHLSAIKQAEAALALLKQTLAPVTGSIRARHQFVDMENFTVRGEFTDDGDQTLCGGALGYSFAAGTDNGRPSAAIYDKGQINKDPNLSCHREKPVLIRAGYYSLLPNILPFQMLQIGSVRILAVPSEMTTMAGRKLRASIQAQYPGPVIIAGLSNEYGHYVATRAEYRAQDYEGASTLYGPWTEAAYRQIFAALNKAIAENLFVPRGPTPRNMSAYAVDFSIGVIADTTPFGMDFGDVVEDASASYQQGETVVVKFVGAHPNNDPKTNDTYLKVQRQQSDNSFLTKYYDWDPNTIMYWQREGIAQSVITIKWTTAQHDEPGIYRICHFGASRFPLRGIQPYNGCSNTFQLRAK